MANKRVHVGILRPTLPDPQVFWGSIQDIADKVGISYRSASNLVNRKGHKTKTGWQRMTPEQEEWYYQPPQATTPAKRIGKYNSKIHWKITFFKNWKKGDRYPTENLDRFSGTPQEFCRFVNCNNGQIYRLINTHVGDPEKYPLRTIKGWTIARIRKYDKKQVRASRAKDG